MLTSMAGFSFIDDTDLLQTNLTHRDKIEHIVGKLQGSLDVWLGTLKTLGGALDYDDPNKSYWYSVEYKWSASGRWKYCAFDNELVMMMFNDNDARKVTPHYHTDDTHKNLGVMLAPDSNINLQFTQMRTTALKFGDKVRIGFISGHDVMHDLHITIMCSITWNLPAITLTETERTYIMVSIVTNILSKLQVM